MTKLSNTDEIKEALESLTDSNSLKPIAPDEAIDQYLSYRQQSIRPQTVEEYRQKLSHFETFCTREGIENLNELDGRLVDRYREYRRRKSVDRSNPLSPKTMQDDMYLFRDFVEYLDQIEGVPSNLPEKVPIPDVGPGEGVRNVEINADRVEAILEYLDQYEHASREHVTYLYLAHTGARPQSLHGLDIEDLHLDGDNPYVNIQHRPGETELKNDLRGERELHLTQEAAGVFQEYIDHHRISITTDNNRNPFLTSNHGRLAKSTIRRYIYKYSRPCVISNGCPHNRDPSDCEAANTIDQASQCPSSRPPYALRHGYISEQLRKGVPKETLSDRCNVSQEILSKHYDERGEEQKRRLRRQVFEELRNNEGTGGYL